MKSFLLQQRRKRQLSHANKQLRLRPFTGNTNDFPREQTPDKHMVLVPQCLEKKQRIVLTPKKIRADVPNLQLSCTRISLEQKSGSKSPKNKLKINLNQKMDTIE